MKLLTYHKISYCAEIYFRHSLKIHRPVRVSLRTLSTQKEPPLTIHEISINSCGSLYEKWRKLGKYSTVPKELNFKVNYFDTGNGSNLDSAHKKQTVVALHGAPGTCNNFSSLTLFLHQKGIRVIVPNFPDFSTYQPGVFRHTDEEKAQFIKDFLAALSISEIDLLICHSSAIYPGLVLCLDQKPIVKSLAMLNPGTFSLKMPSVRHWKSLSMMVKASENPILLKIQIAVGPYIMKLLRIPVRVDNFLDPLLSATVMLHGNILQAKEKFIHLATKGFPIFYAFSEDDKLVGKNNAYELAETLGVQHSEICQINKDGNIENAGRISPTMEVIAFENGSHYVFWKYADFINERVFNFLMKQKST